MAQIIEAPTVINATGQPPKRIEEFIGRLNTPTMTNIGIAHMISPAG